jgi:hypothetical protein
VWSPESPRSAAVRASIGTLVDYLAVEGKPRSGNTEPASNAVDGRRGSGRGAPPESERLQGATRVPRARNEATALTRQTATHLDENTIDLQLLDDLQNSLRDENSPRDSRLEALYREAGVVLPGIALKRLEDVRAFHDSMMANRHSYLEGEIGAARLRIGPREQGDPFSGRSSFPDHVSSPVPWRPGSLPGAPRACSVPGATRRTLSDTSVEREPRLVPQILCRRQQAANPHSASVTQQTCGSWGSPVLPHRDGLMVSRDLVRARTWGGAGQHTYRTRRHSQFGARGKRRRAIVLRQFLTVHLDDFPKHRRRTQGHDRT